MPQRYQSGVMAISQAATTVAHGLAGTPTEYAAEPLGVTQVYYLGVSSTNMVLAAGGVGGASANLFASIPHSIIQ